MATQTIITTSDAIDALGGTKATSEIVGVTQQAVSNCRRQTRFPPAWVDAMRPELERRGYSAPGSLWGQKGRQERAA